MGRILALDVGERTIGVALSDESQTFAFPGTTIQRQAEGHRKDLAAVRTIVEAQEVERVVIGHPVMMDGSEGVQATKASEFARLLARAITVPIMLQDERLSTAESERVLRTAEVPKSKRKAVVDSMAASLILQRYLQFPGGSTTFGETA